MIRFRSLLAATAVIAFASSGAFAEGESLDQYPSFVEFTTQSPDGNTTVLRCGYAASGGTVTIDPSFAEISSVNANHGTYSRLQHIDDFVIASTAPAGTLGLHIELVGTNGTAIARTCQTNTENDTISDCVAAAVNEPASQVLDDDRKLGSQCVGLMQQSMAKIDAALASPDKTQAWKAGLHQKISTLQSGPAQ